MNGYLAGDCAIKLSNCQNMIHDWWKWELLSKKNTT